MDEALLNELYQGEILVNKVAFEGESYRAAFYALACAFQFARELPSDQLLVEVGDIARKQRDWLEQNNSEDPVFETPIRDRDTVSRGFESILRQVETMLQIRTKKKIIGK